MQCSGDHTIRARGNKTFSMQNSAEHDFFLLINIKMPIIVGILTSMCRRKSILGLSEPKKAKFLNMFTLTNINNFMLS